MERLNTSATLLHILNWLPRRPSLPPVPPPYTTSLRCPSFTHPAALPWRYRLGTGTYALNMGWGSWVHVGGTHMAVKIYNSCSILNQIGHRVYRVILLFLYLSVQYSGL